MAEIRDMLKAAALTDVGNVRTDNEDAFGLCGEVGFFVVCDGMGGAAGGEVASQTAVTAVQEAICKSLLKEAPGEALAVAITVANRKVFAASERNASLRGMGTTLVSLLVREESVWIAHVGDSRCYRFRHNVLERQTEDHSFVDEQVRLGQMTPAEAEISPFRNIITRAIGTRDTVEPEIHESAYEPGDVFLLCSDGLTKEVSEARLAEILKENAGAEAEQICSLLVEEAKAAGGHDNITVLAVRIL